MNKEKIINEAMNRFDFEKVQHVMKVLKLEWFDVGGVPSVKELKENAERMLNKLFDEELIAVSSGGLTAEFENEEGIKILSLKFVLEEFDSYVSSW